jgi:arylformamidase
MKEWNSLSEINQPDKTRYYSVSHPEEFKIDWRAFYDKVDALTAEARGKIPHRLNFSYGGDPKQKLDLYLPAERPARCPAFLFLHGGGFREGDRAHYGYLALPFAKHGIITAVASYRLTPNFYYPDQVHDVQLALAWLSRNIQAYGGDPGFLFVGGHSAGAILTAFVSLKLDWLNPLGLPSDLIKGCVAVSSPYDLRSEDWVEEYLPDPNKRAEASPLFNIENLRPQMLVAVGSLEETKGWVQPSKDFVERLKEKGGSADFVLLQGMDHAATALALGDEQSQLFQKALSMIKGHHGKR